MESKGEKKGQVIENIKEDKRANKGEVSLMNQTC